MLNNKKIYKMPDLDENLLKQVIFSMENQKVKSFLDLFNNTIIDVNRLDETVQVSSDVNIGHFDKVLTIDYPNRFIIIPTWGPFEGFKMREDFVNSLKNPVYKERLNKVLHTGRGVFKKFKEVLHSNSLIERQWYSFKESYMKDVVTKWYEYNNGAINLEQLPLDIEELPDDLLLEDFVFEFYENDEKKLQIDKIMNLCFEEINEIEAILIKKRKNIENNTTHLCVLTPEDITVGYIEYKKLDEHYIEILTYGVLPEYRGIGLFNIMLDRLVRQSNREGYSIILLYFTSKIVQYSKTVKNIELMCNLSYNSLDIKSWVKKNASTELLEV